MKKPLLGQKIAVLVANGFLERDLTYTQKYMMNAGADMRIVSMGHGLVNSWREGGWGLNFATDQKLSKALAADYDMLIVPSGSRSVEKLELTAHTRRFIGGFIDTGKPVAFFGDALELLLFSERTEGVEVVGPARLSKRAEEAGTVWSEEPYVVSGNVMSGLTGPENREEYVVAVCRFLVEKSVGDSETQDLHEAVAA